MTKKVAIIGGGPGGYVAAIRAAQKGLSVTLIEAEQVGGVCLNWGCIPSKALLHVGELIERLQQSERVGLTIEGYSLNWAKTLSWKEGVVRRLTQGVAHLLDARKVQVMKGRASFADPHTLHVVKPGSSEVPDVVTADAIIIATGSRSVSLPGIPVDGEQVWDARHALSAPDIPERLMVVGAGVIGLELATLFRQLGSHVHVMDALPDLLPGWDADIVAVLTRQLKQRQIGLSLGSRLNWLERRQDHVDINVQPLLGGEAVTHTANAVLLSVGRRPNSDALQLDVAGVQTDERGFITTDAHCRTNVPHIYAIGDVSSAPLLAHKASREGMVAAEVIAGEPSALDYQAMPVVIYTQPELASVGLTQTAAEATGRRVAIGVFPFAASGRALTADDSAGLVKLVADADTDALLGVHMAGAHVSELLAEATLAIELGATAADMALTIHAHPTLSESMMEVAEAVHQQAIHLLPPRVRESL